MRYVMAIALVLALVSSASAQQTVSVTLTAGQVAAVKQFIGTDDVDKAVRQQVKQWAQHLVAERQERRRQQWIAAMDEATPEVAQQIKALLKLADEDQKVSEEDKAARRTLLLAEACAAYNVAKTGADIIPCPKLTQEDK